MPTSTETQTYIADIDFPTEAPGYRLFIDAADPGAATEALQERLANSRESKGDSVRSVRPFQPILDSVLERIAAGGRYSISWKHEGSFGPVWITDLDAFEAQAEDESAALGPLGVPFGTEPNWEIALPWMGRGEALRLAEYLGLELGES